MSGFTYERFVNVQHRSSPKEAQITTNLSIVRMCQKVRSTFDYVDLPIGVP